MSQGESSPRLAAAEALTVLAGGREVLSAVDLEIAPGEIVSLIGPNGAGKTTLIRAILGVVAPARGRVWRKPGLVVGYVPQRLHLDPVLPLTVERFLGLGRPSTRDERRAALREVGAEHLLEAQMAELSGGEFQRAVLARALLRDPELLILDEPAQGIDFVGQLELYRLIERIRERRGCSVLLVSHDLHVVMGATDRVVCLNRHVCCSGRPEAVSQHPEYVGLFGPRAAARLAIYAHEHDHAHDLAGAVVEPDHKPGPVVQPDAEAGSGRTETAAERARHAG
jgi:zinc transport system ATP-binding protein